MIILIKKYLNYILVISSSIITLYLSSLFYNYKLDKINKEYNDYVVNFDPNYHKIYVCFDFSTMEKIRMAIINLKINSLKNMLGFRRKNVCINRNS